MCHEQDRLDQEHEQAEAMRGYLDQSRHVFLKALNDWKQLDFQDAESCLISVLRDFYTTKIVKEAELEVPQEIDVEDLPF